jgi:hypothetical protein
MKNKNYSKIEKTKKGISSVVPEKLKILIFLFFEDSRQVLLVGTKAPL